MSAQRLPHFIETEIVIDLPPAQAWERLRDLSIPQYYVPGLIRTTFNTERREGIGASRKVHMKDGLLLDETVIDWREGSGFTIRLHQGDKPLMPLCREARFLYRLEDAGDGRTRFRPAMAFAMGARPLGDWFFAALVKKTMVRNLDAVARGMKRFYETGRSANPDFVSE
ncbi:SRPBCC family protein [Denitratisoma sp. DHT3]|uniref:SRPBCC family protein n=1 Tax=Denitratisoma sp. DHT3 TaxID=1981880 RepID=UPI0016457E99|nr:SRPBCC family protein [Denitratisoma sp. DHT3]